MNQVIQTIKTRRSVRAYKQDPVPGDMLDAVLEAGTYAPTGMGRQSPVIVAVTDKDTRNQLMKMNAAVMGTDSDPYYGAPVIVLVLADASAHTYVQDASCVLENMMLAAHSLGLGSVWINREKEMFESKEGKRLLEKWNLPSTLAGVGALALGYPAAQPAPAKLRKDGYIVRV